MGGGAGGGGQIPLTPRSYFLATRSPFPPRSCPACSLPVQQASTGGELPLNAAARLCPQAMPPIIAEMGNPSVARIDGVIVAALVFCTGVYVAAALGGYIAYGRLVETDLLKDFPEGVFATLARLAILLSVSASYPLFMFIARGSVSQVALGKLPQHTSYAQYFGISIALFGTSFGIAMAVTDSARTTFVRGSAAPKR